MVGKSACGRGVHIRCMKQVVKFFLIDFERSREAVKEALLLMVRIDPD